MKTTLTLLLSLALATSAIADDRQALERDIRAKVAGYLDQQKEAHGADAVSELKETKAEIQDDGTSQFSYEQVHGGVTVLSSYARVRTVKGKGPFGKIKVFRDLGGVPTTPAIPLEKATKIAAEELRIADANTSRSQLVIVPRLSLEGAPQDNALAWSFLITPKGTSADLPSYWYVIDAVSGKILLAQDESKEAAASNP